MQASAPLNRELRTARISLIALFSLMGLSYSTWLARLPTVRELLGLTTAELGVVFLSGAVGSLIFVTLAGPLVVRFGGRSVLNVSAVGIGLAFFLEGLGPSIGSVWVLAVGIFLNGAFVALTNVPQNVETAAVERRIGRPILPHFHAAYSIGAVGGSLVGALCAYLDVPIVTQFAIVAVATTAVRFYLIPKVVMDTELNSRSELERVSRARAKRVRRVEEKAGLLPPTPAPGLRASMRARRTSMGSALHAWREPRTLMIGLIIFSASLSEGSANNWLSIAVVDGFAKPESTGAVMLAIFLLSMTVVRLAGAQIIERLGRVDAVRVSAATSIVGLAIFGFVPNFAIATVGIALWGMGAALAFPLGISAASDEPLKAAARVSVVSAHTSIATLAAPPVLGLLAQTVGARTALTTICIFLGLALVVSKAVGPLSPSAIRTHQEQDS